MVPNYNTFVKYQSWTLFSYSSYVNAAEGTYKHTLGIPSSLENFSLQYNEDRKMKALICSMGQRK